MYGAVRPLLFALPPHLAHSLAFAALGPFEHAALLRAAAHAGWGSRIDPRLAVDVMGLRFPSPIGLAAGFDKNARRIRSLAALGFGHLEVGTITAQAQAPNPPPNLFRLPLDRALVNRLGFPNEGAERVAARLAAARPSVRVPIGVSIGKSRAVAADSIAEVIADYASAFDRVRSVADFVVVNVSSPNTEGLRTLQGRDHARALLSALQQRGGSSCRLLVKVSPDLDEAQLDALCSVVDSVSLDGVVAVNTTVTRDRLRTNPKRLATIGAGGLSGAPLKSLAVAAVRRARLRLGARAVVIGVGGVESADDAVALLRAGANLVQLYTALIYEGPRIATRIGRDLLRVVERERLGSVAALSGTSGQHGHTFT
jgi:dihydroorotate dehydrogenase